MPIVCHDPRNKTPTRDSRYTKGSDRFRFRILQPGFRVSWAIPSTVTSQCGVLACCAKRGGQIGTPQVRQRTAFSWVIIICLTYGRFSRIWCWEGVVVACDGSEAGEEEGRPGWQSMRSVSWQVQGNMVSHLNEKERLAIIHAWGIIEGFGSNLSHWLESISQACLYSNLTILVWYGKLEPYASHGVWRISGLWFICFHLA